MSKIKAVIAELASYGYRRVHAVLKRQALARAAISFTICSRFRLATRALDKKQFSAETLSAFWPAPDIEREAWS